MGHPVVHLVGRAPHVQRPCPHCSSQKFDSDLRLHVFPFLSVSRCHSLTVLSNKAMKKAQKIIDKKVGPSEIVKNHITVILTDVMIEND